MGIWQSDRSYGLDAYKTLWDQDFRENEFNYRTHNDDRDYAYKNFRDSQAQDNKAYDNAYTAAFDAYKSEYQAQRDAVSDDMWKQNFDYQIERDKIADDHCAKEFALKQAAAARAAAKASSKSGKSAKEAEVNPTQARNDAYNYAYYIMNNTYGPEGENAAVGHLMRLVNEGGLTEEQFDWITDKLGVTEEKLDMNKIAQYL